MDEMKIRELIATLIHDCEAFFFDREIMRAILDSAKEIPEIAKDWESHFERLKTNPPAGVKERIGAKFLPLTELAIHGLSPAEDDRVFTRSNGAPVSDFRATWAKACCKAGLGQMFCQSCGVPAAAERCACKRRRLTYRGLIFHDLRRTAARNLRRAGNADGIIMKIGGWKTRSVFERYAIVSQQDMTDAMSKLEADRERREFGHSFGHSDKKGQDSDTPTSVN